MMVPPEGYVGLEFTDLSTALSWTRCDASMLGPSLSALLECTGYAYDPVLSEPQPSALQTNKTNNNEKI